MIDLHSNPTPNGYKPAIMLEETGLPYRAIRYDVMKGEHLTPEFRALNPNLKIPVLVDLDPEDGGEPITIFESGAILLYLAEKTGKFYATELRRRNLIRQWLIWQVAGLGPMHGQAHHFVRYAPDDQAYGVQRYMNEAKRQLSVMEFRLGQAEYLAEEYSIADIACWPYINVLPSIGIDITEFPKLDRWWQKIGERPAVQKIYANPEAPTPHRLIQRRVTLTDEEWSNVFGHRMHAAARANEDRENKPQPETQG